MHKDKQKPFLIDTHCHLYFDNYKDDYKEVIKKALEKNIWIIMPGVDLASSRRAVEIANEYEKGVYAAVGIHPSSILDALAGREKIDYEPFRKLAQDPKVVALGEIGLDYYHLKNIVSKHNVKVEYFIEKQKEVFKEFINLSQDLRMPLIIHCREGSRKIAHNDLINILEEFDRASKGFDTRGVMHCYSGNWEQAKKYLNLDFFISFTGIVTFKSFNGIELIKKIPTIKLLTETDSPFLSPEPNRGKRNEPINVEFIAKKLAEIKSEDFKVTSKILTENAINLFKL